ncbi:MAG TPA: hypothetical protein VMP68_12950 [Candidatus Eisenbacteria bacterium]|nr:hypothetical protein [Candidatus Eisenbacteria bacterium]
MARRAFNHELRVELWIGDPAEIRAKRVPKQKSSAGCAAISATDVGESLSADWVPDAENGDLRQLLWHRHRMVQARQLP